MISVKVDGQNNIVLDGYGNIILLNGADAIRQNVTTALKILRGKMPLDMESGVLYEPAVFDVYLPLMLESSIRETVTSVHGVTAVNSINMRQTGEVLEFQVTYTSTFGPDTVDISSNEIL